MEDREQKQRAMLFNENNVVGAKIDRLTSMIGKLITQHKLSKPFKPRVYQGKGQSLINSRRADQSSNINKYRFYNRCRGHNGNNQNIRGKNNFKR